MKLTFSATEAAQITRKSRSTLARWERSGHLVPSERDWRGRPRYTVDDLADLITRPTRQLARAITHGEAAR